MTQMQATRIYTDKKDQHKSAFGDQLYPRAKKNKVFSEARQNDLSYE